MGKTIWLCLLLIVLITGIVDAQGRKPQCAQNGEYCLTHNDCCSGSCLSFSYKCVPVPPSASTGTILVPVQPVPIDTENRFGGGDDGGASLTQKTCALNGEYCQTHGECCSGNCLTFSYKCVPVTQTDSSPREPNKQTTLDFSNRVGEDTASTIGITKTTSAVTTPKQCAGIGEYCLTPNDCCSGSCLSFSYKCVTNHQLKGPTSQGAAALPSNSFVNRFGGSSDTSTSTAKCAAVGEYCLTSSECCSKSCLSFAYKCVNRYDLASNIDQASHTSSISVENRFGGPPSSSGGPLNRQCASNGLYCSHNQECCSGACYKSICSTEIKLGVPESELTRPSPSNGPYVPVKNLDDLINRFGGNTSANQQPNGRQLSAKQCKAVGETCTLHADCCTNNCHSYRRKCVN
ncbi:uncharacterized protein LOC131261276 [Anopheles coustani]|uniref:uncharacterized protein LOC131261276 n=1 Tax=Anopheles coustani TaxID=139045 RepID=UPI00265AF345|nr:uncharacterized protein LOC131261276 [Anopheles coustani]